MLKLSFFILIIIYSTAVSYFQLWKYRRFAKITTYNLKEVQLINVNR